jgi:hypothetical protein
MSAWHCVSPDEFAAAIALGMAMGTLLGVAMMAGFLQLATPHAKEEHPSCLN